MEQGPRVGPRAATGRSLPEAPGTFASERERAPGRRRFAYASGRAGQVEEFSCAGRDGNDGGARGAVNAPRG